MFFFSSAKKIYKPCQDVTLVHWSWITANASEFMHDTSLLGNMLLFGRGLANTLKNEHILRNETALPQTAKQEPPSYLQH